jgi:hypothetical protein
MALNITSHRQWNNLHDMPELHYSEQFEWENYFNTGCSKRLSSKAAASEAARRYGPHFV